MNTPQPLRPPSFKKLATPTSPVTNPLNQISNALPPPTPPPPTPPMFRKTPPSSVIQQTSQSSKGQTSQDVPRISVSKPLENIHPRTSTPSPEKDPNRVSTTTVMDTTNHNKLVTNLSTRAIPSSSKPLPDAPRSPTLFTVNQSPIMIVPQVAKTNPITFPTANQTSVAISIDDLQIPKRSHAPPSYLPFLHAPKGKYARSAASSGDSAMISLAKGLDVERDGLISSLLEAHNCVVRESKRADIMEKQYNDLFHQCQRRILSLESQIRVLSEHSRIPDSESGERELILIQTIQSLEEENSILALRVIEAEKQSQKEMQKSTEISESLELFLNR